MELGISKHRGANSLPCQKRLQRGDEMPAEHWKMSRNLPKVSGRRRAFRKEHGTCRELRTQQQFAKAQIQFG